MIPDNLADAKYRVLVIEDDLIDQENVSRSLSRAKETFSITFRECFQDGVEALRQEEFDLILLDLSLPDSYGLQTVERMAEEFKTTPIIVSSGSDDKQLVEDAFLRGAEDYLVKGNTSCYMLSETIVFVIELCRSSNEEIAAQELELMNQTPTVTN